MTLSKSRSIAVEVSPWAAVTGLILLTWADSIFGSRGAILATALLVCSLVMHELGHVAAASIRAVRVSAIGFCAAGTYIRRQRAPSQWEELGISLAGPIASFAAAALFCLGTGHVYRWIAELNLVIALSNLIPIAGTDGNRAVNAICLATADASGPMDGIKRSRTVV